MHGVLPGTCRGTSSSRCGVWLFTEAGMAAFYEVVKSQAWGCVRPKESSHARLVRPHNKGQ